MLGVFFYENQGVRQGLFDKLKAKLAPELNLSEDTGLDLSEISVENFDSGAKEEQGELSPVRERFSNGVSSLSLEQIKEKLDEVEAKKQDIEREVNKLIILQEIEQKIDEITKQAEILSQQVKTLGSLYQNG